MIVGGDSGRPEEMASPEINRLAEVAAAEEVADRVVFAGRRERDQLRYYYSAADVFVTTPSYEPFGITPLEAMACRTAVVASDVGGLKSTVRDGETGSLVSPGEPDQLGECLAGGVALNCVLNSRLRDSGHFRNVWVQPAAGDAGTALGAVLAVDHAGREADVSRKSCQVMSHAYLGPSYDDAEIGEFLQWSKVPFRRLDNIAEETSALLAEDKIIGWFQGRMEFGPRALGARSILASPISADMQSRLNEIKDREDFRPVAPAVLEEAAPEWFENAGVSPFMLFVNDVKPDKAARIPAVRHVDGTARIQTVNRSQNLLYHGLLAAFAARTGVPVPVNTSFNTRGEPVVRSPRDALECFWTSPLDALVIGSFRLEKPRA